MTAKAAALGLCSFSSNSFASAHNSFALVRAVAAVIRKISLDIIPHVKLLDVQTMQHDGQKGCPARRWKRDD
jgi:hypothetical protein